MKAGVLLAFSAVLAACGRREEPERRPAAPATTIVFRHARPHGFDAFFRQIIERFERENPGIRVVDEYLPPDSDQQRELYTVGFASGAAGFDLLAVDIVWIAEFSRAGWLADLTPYLPPEEQALFLPSTMAAARRDGRPYALPWFTDAGLLYYRKDLLDRFGHAPPATWSELIRIARDVVGRAGGQNLVGFVWQGKRSEALVCNALEYLASNGVDLVDAQGRWSADSPRAEAALALMSGLVHREGVSPELVLAADEESTRRIFGEGRAVFLRNWPYALAHFKKPGNPVEGRVGIGPLPSFPGRPSAGTLGGWYFGVNARSTHPQEAYRLARYLSSPEVQRLVFDRMRYLPTRSVLYRDPELLAREPELAAFERILAGARPRPATPEYRRLSETLQGELSAMLAEQKTPAQALRDARARFEPAAARRP